MFTGGELSRAPMGPLFIIAGTLIVIAFTVGLLVGRWAIPEKPSLDISDICDRIRSAVDIAWAMPNNDETAELVMALYTLSWDTCVHVSDTPKKPD